MSEQNLNGYEAALHGTAFYPEAEASYLAIEGEDRAAFLQRQTTNDIQLLAPNRALFSVLTSPNARILDVLYVIQEAQTIDLISLPGFAEKTASFLRGRIMFNDDITVNNVSDLVTQIDLIGPQSEELLKRFGAKKAPELNEIVDFQLDQDTTVRALATDPAFSLGYRLLVPSEAGIAMQKKLQDAGSVLLTPEHHLYLRLEAGQPAAGYELTEDYTPLEMGLLTAISDAKGCYTGQEVIARQVNYDKVTRHLCGIRLDGWVDPGSKVWAGEKAAGEITSAVVSPRFGPIALAVLRRPFHEPGTRVQISAEDIEYAEAAGSEGTVVSLPFAQP